MSKKQITLRTLHYDYEDNAVTLGRTQIRAYGVDVDGKAYLCRFDNYSIPVTIVFSWEIDGVEIDWFKNQHLAKDFVETLQDFFSEKDYKINNFRESHFKWLRPYYDVQLKEWMFDEYTWEELKEMIADWTICVDPAVIVHVSCEQAARDIQRKLNYPIWLNTGGRRLKISAKVYMNEFNPVDKFLIYNNIKHADWITFKGTVIADNYKARRNLTVEKILRGVEIDLDDEEESEDEELVYDEVPMSEDLIEVIVDIKTIRRVPDNLTKTMICNPKIFSFDIECDTPNHNKFVEAMDEACPVRTISCGIMRNDGSELESYMFMLGDCPPDDKYTVVPCKTEEQLIFGMLRLLKLTNPDFITGFNIQGFDLEYIHHRISAIIFRKWPVIGRLKGVRGNLRVEHWDSSAYKGMKICHLLAPGRIVLDIYNEVKRSYKFPQNNLNYVANYFLGTGKIPLPMVRMFEGFKIIQKGMDLGVHSKEYKQGLEEAKMIADYCNEDQILCLRLFQTMLLCVDAMETANIMCVNIYDLNTRGQQHRGIRMIGREAVYRNYYMDRVPLTEIPFEGGLVQKNQPGIFTDVIDVDFNSLYPSVMDGYNICPTSYIRDEAIRKLIPREDCNIKEINCVCEDKEDDDDDDDEDNERDGLKIKGDMGMKEFWWIKEDILKGLVPTIVASLISKRRELQAEMKKYEHGSMTRTILDKQQNAVKVSTNSLYGFYGAGRNGKRPFREGAMVVTAYGRELITATRDYLVATYNANIIYGDTDSLMFQVNDHVKDRADLHAMGVRLCEEISALFKTNRIVIKLEECGDMLSIMKKKYIFWIYAEDGTPKLDRHGREEKIVRGVMTARRDNSQWARTTYGYLLENARTLSCYDAMKYLYERVRMMYDGEVDYKELLINKAIGSNYKKENAPMNVFANNMRALDKVVESGERIYYLVTKSENKKASVASRMLLDDIYLQYLGTEKEKTPDYNYYVENTLQKQVDALIFILYRHQLRKRIPIKKFTFPSGEYKARGCAIMPWLPVKMMCKIVNAGYPLEVFLELLEGVKEHLM